MPSDRPPLALVLAGGRGRRLAPYTTVFPKPLAPVGDVPILEVLLRQLARAGIEEVVISLGHLGELIEAYLLARTRASPRISFVREDEPLGTAGPIGLLEREVCAADVLVLNGDVLTNLDYRQLWSHHRERGADLTVAVQSRPMSVDLGVVECDDDGQVTAYVEKPSVSFECAMGVNVYSPAAVASVTRGERLDFPDLVGRLLAERRRVDAFRTECYWADIGRREDYEAALDDFERLRHDLLPES
jgi:NDP-sugar pyrophosphorylase family protein